VLHKDHGRNLGGKAKGKVCTAIMYENIQNYETEINILQCILYPVFTIYKCIAHYKKRQNRALPLECLNNIIWMICIA
jgi:hypothetical protein